MLPVERNLARSSDPSYLGGVRVFSRLSRSAPCRPEPAFFDQSRLRPRAGRAWPIVTLLLALVLAAAHARAELPRVDMRRAKVVDGRVTAPTTQGTAVLTLDAQLQQDVETLLRRARAPESAAVVLDVRTGRVLAWATIDPAGRDLVSEPYAPPASLFKVVTAAALLERSNARPSTRQCYVGGERSVSLSYLRANGADGARCSTFSSALGYSRNMVMAGLAVRFLEASDVLTTADKLGINGHVPIDVAVGSGSCRVPTSKEGLARAAAGFGRGRLTTLEAAYMMAVVARNGERPKIELVDHLLTSDGRRQSGPAPAGPTGRALRTSTAASLARMLEVTVREGTAARAFRDASGQRYLGHFGGAGKTGTLARGKPTRLFSWYAGFAPARNPQVVVAVLLANEHRWWRKSNEVARDVLRAYFSRKNVAGVTHPTRRRSARK